jgi:uncharacterized membrane protein YqaE (UPF0057 family)
MKTTVTRFVTVLLSLALFTAPAQAAFVSKPAPAPTETTAPAAPATDEASVTSAAKESWNSISKQERKDRIRAAKDAIRNWKNTPESGGVNQLLLVIITIILPPVGVLIHEGHLNSKFWISLLLTLLFYVPGLIYSLLVIFDAI